MKNRESVLARYREMASFEDFDIKGFDQPGADGDAPIHVAAYMGNLEDIKVMLEDSIDINLVGDIGNTPLHYSALKGHKEVVKYLLSKGADPRIKNDYGDTPLDSIQDPDSEIADLLEGNKGKGAHNR